MCWTGKCDVKTAKNDIVVYKGKNLKVITIRDNSDYGFYKAIGEQIL